jgi:predicted flap endonuclease-1-like 5' DNA nuclease
MTNIPHIVETALLVLAAYVLGCVIGYGLHRVMQAAQGTRVVPPVLPETAPEPAPRRVPTTAARLAAAAANDPAPDAPLRPATPPAAPPPAADPRPTALTGPRGGKADNLKQIKGIGPKIESSLNAMGIFHLDQIAAWDRANIDWVDSHLAFKGRIRREQWVAQAARLLAGN